MNLPASPRAILIAATSTLITSSVWAAPQVITGATFQNIADLTTISTGGSFTGPSNITSFSDLTGSYLALAGATSNDIPNFPTNDPPPVTPETGAPERFYFGAAGIANYPTYGPATSAVALTGVRADDGLLNVGANVGAASNFQLGSAFTAGNRAFILDLNATTAGYDAFGIQLIDASNAVVGDYLLNIPATLWGASAGSGTILASYGPVGGSGGDPNLGAIRSNTLGIISTTAQFGLYGVSFSITDFVGSTGDLATVTGIRLTGTGGAGNSGGFDPSVIGVAVPEPSTVGLIIVGLSFGGMALRRRRSAIRG